MMISIFDLAAMLLTLSAIFGWLNRRVLHFPHSIGLLVMGLVLSLLLGLLQALLPEQQVYAYLTRMLQQINFTDVVMNGMLAFLLFAGAMRLDVDVLRDRALPICVLAFFGTVLSTILVGFTFWWMSHVVGHPVPVAWALVFGALISPTDPVAVLSMLKGVRIPGRLRVEMQGEALFNDGLAIVLFVTLVGYATGTSTHVDLTRELLYLLREAGGGVALGLATGYVAYRGIRTIDDFPVEVLITLALVTTTYSLARKLGVSGPLAVVAAGLVIGHSVAREAMSEETRRYISGLWTLIDEVLNSVLFLLIGLEVLLLPFQVPTLVLAAAAIPIALLARMLALSAPLLLFPWSKRLSARNVPFLTWAGVHGGISVALALALPDSEAKPYILSATYAVVLFTLLVQGSTLGWMARRTLGEQLRDESSEGNVNEDHQRAN